MQDFLNRKFDGEKFYRGVFEIHCNLIIPCDQFLVQLGTEKITDF